MEGVRGTSEKILGAIVPEHLSCEAYDMDFHHPLAPSLLVASSRKPFLIPTMASDRGAW